MFTKLAIWFLRKRRVSVIMGCELTGGCVKSINKRLYIYDNKLLNTECRTSNGEDLIIPKGKFSHSYTTHSKEISPLPGEESIEKYKGISLTKQFCEWHIKTTQNTEGADCSAHLHDGRIFKCPYNSPEDREKAKYPCSDYKPKVIAKNDIQVDILVLVLLLRQRLESFYNNMLQLCQSNEDRELEKHDYENYLTYLKLLETRQFDEAQRLLQEMDTQAREILHHILEGIFDQRQKQIQQPPKNRYEYESTNPFEIMLEAKKRYQDNPTAENRREYEAQQENWSNYHDRHLADKSRLEREERDRSRTRNRER